MYEKKTDDEQVVEELDNASEQVGDYTVTCEVGGAVDYSAIVEELNFEPAPNVDEEKLEAQLVSIGEDVFGKSGVSAEMQLWGDILLELKQNGDNILGAICEMVDKTKINGNNFELYMHSNEFDNIQYFNMMQEVVKKVANLNLKVCKDLGAQQANSADIEYLKNKFGEKLIII